jgi:hypothetical protein
VGEIAVLVPVLGRPHRAQPLADAFREATSVPYRLVFLCSLGDDEEYDACNQTGELTLRVPWVAGPGDWARKINHGYRVTDEPWILCGADDLAPQPGWAEAAFACAHPGVGVIGTNDLGNPTVMRGDHSTHPLVARWYADEHGTVDGPGQVVTEAYGHQWTDTELVQTAMARGAWVFAEDSHVTHLHPFWGKGEDDATYRKGMASSREDQRLFQSRRRLWSVRRTV